jgi:heme A synthase
MRQRWRQTIGSALLYALAFNLTFFIQELFLVVPKALTPGLRPTLYHNNHLWLGENPLALLLQGTGALAIFISAIVCTLLLQGDRIRSATVRLSLLWMAFSGFFQALPQVVIGAFVDNNDVGMAMNYLRMTPQAKVIAAFAALAAMIPIGSRLAREMLRFMPLNTFLSALLAIPLIVAFRVPRELLEVLVPPLLSTFLGLAAVYATAWRIKDVAAIRDPEPVSIAYPLAAVIALLLVFQLVLRPGIEFY